MTKSPNPPNMNHVRELVEEGVIPNFYSLLTTLYYQLTRSLAINKNLEAYSIAKSIIGLLRLKPEERRKLLEKADKMLEIGYKQVDIKECRDIIEKNSVERVIAYGYYAEKGCFIIYDKEKILKIIAYDSYTSSYNSALQDASNTVDAFRWLYLNNFVSSKLAPLVQRELEYYRSIEVYEQK